MKQEGKSAAKRPRSASTSQPELLLPGATRRQTQLLIHCLYSFLRESFANGLSPPELIDLARIADRFGCKQVCTCMHVLLVRFP